MMFQPEFELWRGDAISKEQNLYAGALHIPVRYASATGLAIALILDIP